LLKPKYTNSLSCNTHQSQGHTWYADEPSDKGGQDTAPNPIQILLSALGACTVVTLEMYANHKGLKIEHVQLDLALNPEGDPRSRSK
jgi:putative redox protein